MKYTYIGIAFCVFIILATISSNKLQIPPGLLILLGFLSQHLLF